VAKFLGLVKAFPINKISVPSRSALQAERSPILGLSQNIFDRAPIFYFLEIPKSDRIQTERPKVRSTQHPYLALKWQIF
jgi:hypothetical protein